MSETIQAEFPVNSIRICIDSYDDDACKGEICGVAIKKPVPFHSLSELVVRIDDAFNRIGQPQSGQILRSFQSDEHYQSYVGKPVRYFASEDIAARRGTEKTVDLIMLSRHKAEWQGILKNQDGQVVGKFNSILECANLLKRA